MESILLGISSQLIDLTKLVVSDWPYSVEFYI